MITLPFYLEIRQMHAKEDQSQKKPRNVYLRKKLRIDGEITT